MISNPLKLDPEKLKQMKEQYKQSHSGHNNAKSAAARTGGCEDQCSSQSQSPTQSEDVTPAHAANAPAALPSETPAAESHNNAIHDSDADKSDAIPGPEKSADPAGHASDTGTPAAGEPDSAVTVIPDDAVLPVVTAVMEKITDAVVAAENLSADVLPHPVTGAAVSTSEITPAESDA
jgi:hypothetical protein